MKNISASCWVEPTTLDVLNSCCCYSNTCCLRLYSKRKECMVSENNVARALLCCVREVMFFKRSLNISELILSYFKYFYGMGCFLSSLKCLALTLNCKNIRQLLTEMWFWAVTLTYLVVFHFCTFHLKEKWMTMLQRWRKWRWASAFVKDCMNDVWNKNMKRNGIRPPNL